MVENALDAAANGATILTHARVERFRRDPGQGPAVTGAVVRDARSGETFEVRARLTVNATGPWLDRTDGEVRPGRPPLLRLTKGVHLVTPPGRATPTCCSRRRTGASSSSSPGSVSPWWARRIRTSRATPARWRRTQRTSPT